MTDRFEEGCAPHPNTTVEEQAVDCLASIAISLKRIADALNERNEYGEGPAAAIGGSIKRSLQR